VGNILVNWLISDSVGTRIPALVRSVLPVNSSTHSLITELLELVELSPTSTLPSVFRNLAVVACVVDDGLLEVVMTSSFSCVASPASGPLAGRESSGNARVERRGGRREPISGSIKRLEKVTADIGIRYALKLAISER